MQAIVGDDPDAFQVGTGVFPPVLPSATEVGLEPLTGPRSLDRSKALMKAAGFNGEPIRLLAGTDIHTIAAISAVAADLFRRLGFNLDLASSDMATVLARQPGRAGPQSRNWSGCARHGSKRRTTPRATESAPMSNAW